MFATIDVISIFVRLYLCTISDKRKEELRGGGRRKETSWTSIGCPPRVFRFGERIIEAKIQATTKQVYWIIQIFSRRATPLENIEYSGV